MIFATFYDRVDVLSRNQVRTWLDAQQYKVAAKFEHIMGGLERMPFEDWARDRTYFAHLSERQDGCGGLFEVRIAHGSRRQYRILGKYLPNERIALLLAGGIEVKNNFDPPNLCRIAQTAFAQIPATNPEKYRVRHEFSPTSRTD